MTSRRMMLGLLFAAAFCLVSAPGDRTQQAAAAKQPKKGKQGKKTKRATLYVRYQHGDEVSPGTCSHHGDPFFIDAVLFRMGT